MNKNFVERGSQEVDKDLPKNKWRWDWLVKPEVKHQRNQFHPLRR